MFLSKKLFTDASSADRPSQKLTALRIGSFKVIELIGKNAMKPDFSDGISIHPVIHVKYTARAYRQPLDTSIPTEFPAQPLIDKNGECLIKV